MGFLESYLATVIAAALRSFAQENGAGIVCGADAPIMLLPDQVRIPDVCFVSWERLPEGKLPLEPVPAFAPDLAVEVLSPGNTPQEMERKLRDYFAAGVRLVWYVEPRERQVRVFSGPQEESAVRERLDGGDVLPGFELSLAELFAELDRARGESRQT